MTRTTVYVTIKNKGTKRVPISLDMTLGEFREYLLKKLKVDYKYWTLSIEFEIGQKELNNNTKTLRELGVCHNSRIIVNSESTCYQEVIPLDIKEESEEDDVLQDALTSSLNNAFDTGLIRTRKPKPEIKYMEYEMIEMDNFVDHNKEINQAELERIHKIVSEASSAPKIKLKLHTLNSLKQNLEHIFAKHLSTAESLTKPSINTY